MSNTILKGLAVAAGTGVAVGIGSGRQRQKAMSDSSSDEKMIERLDRIELRLDAVEHSNRDTLAGLLESTLAPHIDDLRSRLNAEMQESMDARLDEFEKSIDSKVSTRISALENALIEQSSVITVLSKRAVEAEENFQRLIAAVERLCEQKEAGRPSVTPAAFEAPFEQHLKDAIQRQPAAAADDHGFRPRIVSEEEAKSSRHRRPMSRLR